MMNFFVSTLHQFGLVCACMGIMHVSHPVDWKALTAEVAAKHWQGSAEKLDSIDVRTLSPSEAAAYCYYMGVCACHLPGREAFGRALLLDLLQHRMSKIGDASMRSRLKMYINSLLNHTAPEPVEEWDLASNGTGHSGHFSGKAFFLGDMKTEIKPLRVLANTPILSHTELLKSLQMPQEEAISSLNAQMHFGPESSISAIQTTNTYSMIVVAKGTNHPESTQQTELIAFDKDIDTALAFLHKEFGVTLPHERMVLFTVAGTQQLQAVARRLHGIEQSSINIGYAVPDEFTAVATGEINEHRNAGTLYHELCHIVLQNDFPGIPGWLDEGLASVYSVFSFQNGAMYGTKECKWGGQEGQWRGEVLRRVGKWHPSATDLVRLTSDAFFDPQTPREGFDPSFFEGGLPPLVATQATNNATACYLLLYLQETGKLSLLYKAFRDRDLQTVTGDVGAADVQLLKQIAGENIDHEFEEWLNVTIPHGTP